MLYGAQNMKFFISLWPCFIDTQTIQAATYTPSNTAPAWSRRQSKRIGQRRSSHRNRLRIWDKFGLQGSGKQLDTSPSTCIYRFVFSWMHSLIWWQLPLISKFGHAFQCREPFSLAYQSQTLLKMTAELMLYGHFYFVYVPDVSGKGGGRGEAQHQEHIRYSRTLHFSSISAALMLCDEYLIDYIVQKIGTTTLSLATFTNGGNNRTLCENQRCRSACTKNRACAPPKTRSVIQHGHYYCCHSASMASFLLLVRISRTYPAASSAFRLSVTRDIWVAVSINTCLLSVDRVAISR